MHIAEVCRFLLPCQSRLDLTTAVIDLMLQMCVVAVGPHSISEYHPTHPPFVLSTDLLLDWNRNGRWFMRLISSGIPVHSYGQGKQQWDHLVAEQQWDITIPLISDEDGIDAFTALQRNVEPTEFLIEAAREDRPIGMALNGVPFFSPLTPTGAYSEVSTRTSLR